jgi:beta-fructofuranosidase
MLRLADKWIWDSWTVDDGPDHHLFYLQARREGHYDERHWSATIGHAFSTDYEKWTLLPDALGPARSPAWDDLATWTGSVVRAPTGTWHMFYSAIAQREKGAVQRIGRADSDDLITWRRHGTEPVVQADPRWYETLDLDSWREEAWRDPFVFPDPDGHGWHMLITGRVRQGARFDRGVVGHARSPDLDIWEVQPPLTRPAGFGQMEVPHVAYVGGQPVLLFCCLAADLDDDRRKRTPYTGMWSAPAASLLGPFDVAAATPFEDPSLYAAHLVQIDGEQPGLLGFRYMEDDRFVGEIPAPVPVRLTADGTITMNESQGDVNDQGDDR